MCCAAGEGKRDALAGRFQPVFFSLGSPLESWLLDFRLKRPMRSGGEHRRRGLHGRRNKVKSLLGVATVVGDVSAHARPGRPAHPPPQISVFGRRVLLPTIMVSSLPSDALRDPHRVLQDFFEESKGEGTDFPERVASYFANIYKDAFNEVRVAYQDAFRSNGVFRSQSWTRIGHQRNSKMLLS